MCGRFPGSIQVTRSPAAVVLGAPRHRPLRPARGADTSAGSGPDGGRCSESGCASPHSCGYERKARSMSSWTSTCRSMPIRRYARTTTSVHTPTLGGTSPPGYGIRRYDPSYATVCVVCSTAAATSLAARPRPTAAPGATPRRAAPRTQRARARAPAALIEAGRDLPRIRGSTDAPGDAPGCRVQCGRHLEQARCAPGDATPHEAREQPKAPGPAPGERLGRRTSGWKGAGLARKVSAETGLRHLRAFVTRNARPPADATDPRRRLQLHEHQKKCEEHPRPPVPGVALILASGRPDGASVYDEQLGASRGSSSSAARQAPSSLSASICALHAPQSTWNGPSSVTQHDVMAGTRSRQLLQVSWSQAFGRTLNSDRSY